MNKTAFTQQSNIAHSSCCSLPLGQLSHLEDQHLVDPLTASLRTEEPMDDAALAKELNELSFGEREEVFDDIHAVAKVPAETPEILKQGLKEMDQSLEKIPPRRRKNLNRALFLCPKLENDNKFKLMFLRAELYDPIMAADRMARYYDMKCELFGEEKVAKRITIQDLSEEDVDVIKSGCLITLPAKDPAGRPLIFADHSKMDFRRVQEKSLARCFWYLIMSITYDDEMAQKMGIGGIAYNAGDIKQELYLIPNIATVIRRMGKMTVCIPARFSSMRICSVKKKPALDFFIKTFRLSVEKFTRLRITNHMGSDLELEYTLMSVGIQCGRIFRNSRQDITTAHEAFVQKRFEIDIQKEIDLAAEESESGLVSYPSSNDVLAGRGAPYRFFPGNQRWEQLIQSHVKRFAESSNFDKTCISWEMVKAFQEGGGRFLQRKQGGWKALDSDACREKAIRAFRTKLKSG